jgi:hypothetical protein
LRYYVTEGSDGLAWVDLEGKNFGGKSLAPLAIYAYTVKEVNENGKYNLSHAVDIKPESWLNFDPRPRKIQKGSFCLD